MSDALEVDELRALLKLAWCNVADTGDLVLPPSALQRRYPSNAEMRPVLAKLARQLERVETGP